MLMTQLVSPSLHQAPVVFFDQNTGSLKVEWDTICLERHVLPYLDKDRTPFTDILLSSV